MYLAKCASLKKSILKDTQTWITMPAFSTTHAFRSYVKNNTFINKVYQTSKKKPRFKTFFNKTIIKEFILFQKYNAIATNVREQLIISFIKSVQQIITRYYKSLSKSITNMEKHQHENFLRKIYGGRQLHINSAFTYYPKENNSNISDIKNRPQSQIIQSSTNPCCIDQRNILTQPQSVNNNQSSAECNSTCSIRIDWATRLFNFFKRLANAKSYTNMKKAFIEFEFCNKCNGDYNKCVNNSTCQDLLFSLSVTAVHYQHLRTIVRRLYEIRALNIYIIQIEYNASVGELPYFFREFSIKEQNSYSETNFFNNSDARKDIEQNIVNHEKMKTLTKDFAQELQKRLDLEPCSICKKLNQRKNLTKIKKNRSQTQNAILFRLFESPDLIDQVLICRNYCYNDIFNRECIPTYSKLNNVFIHPTPEQIKTLNPFEKMLCQRAKCFQTIHRLKGYQRNNFAKGLIALKGLAIHLPLNLVQTNQYVVDTLPNYNAVHILVSSLPTKTNNIWRSLVNLGKVYEAITWLKANNKEFSQIQISKQSHLPLYGLCTFLKKNNCDDNEIDANLPSYLKGYTEYENIRHFTVLDLDKVNTFEKDVKKYSCKSIENPIMNHNDKHLDLWCFPDVFPFGTNGIHQERQIKIKEAMFYKHVLLNEVPGPRRNIQYIFSCLNNKDIRSSEQGMFASLNTTKFKNITAKTFLDNVDNEDTDVDKNLAMTMGAVRNSQEYWKKVCSKLGALNKHFGCFTFFGTISPAEYHWTELHEFLKKRCSDLPNVNQLSLNELIEMEPLMVSYFFEQKMSTFFSKIILNNGGPLGKVIAHFWRREYQARGAPHVHYKIKIEGAPVYGVDSDEDVIKFIDKHITCRLPDKKTEPLLYDLVTKYQLHRCTDSCLRKKNYRGKISVQCRYGFPRAVSPKTTLNSVDDTMTSKLVGRGTKKIYNLKRTEAERYINDYNDKLIVIWGGNMDLQFIGEDSMVLDRYVTGYITKPEQNATKKLWEDAQKAKTLRGKLKSYSLQYFKSREAGIYEVCDKLLSFPLYDFSTKVQWINTYPKQNRQRLLKRYNDIKNLHNDDTDLFYNNMVDDYYPNRPDELEAASLFSLMTWYEYKSKKCEPSHKLCLALKNNLGFLHKRNDEKVLQTPNIKCIDDKSIENYFHQLLFLFLPWDKEEDLLVSYDSYVKAFEFVYANHEKYKFDCDNYNKFTERDKKVQISVEKAKKIISEHEQRKIDLDQPNQLVQQNENILGVGDYNVPVVTFEEVSESTSKLNSGQKQVFDKVTSTIEHRQEHKNKTCLCPNCPPPLRLFTSGVAGTGKSFLINTICKRLNHLYQDPNNEQGWVVAVLAPTGLAAYNVNGITMHRFFKLPVANNTNDEYWRLSDKEIKVIRECIPNLKLIIIGNISFNFKEK
jgi:ATP-dependent DNA helicase PIF1